jgi:hypothetical protein
VTFIWDVVLVTGYLKSKEIKEDYDLITKYIAPLMIDSLI